MAASHINPKRYMCWILGYVIPADSNVTRFMCFNQRYQLGIGSESPCCLFWQEFAETNLTKANLLLHALKNGYVRRNFGTLNVTSHVI
jgi:hypothetical protein